MEENGITPPQENFETSDDGRVSQVLAEMLMGREVTSEVPEGVGIGARITEGLLEGMVDAP